jgi:CIC family chloride channel protein
LKPDSTAIGRLPRELDWPPGHLPVSVIHKRQLVDADTAGRLAAGDRINILAPKDAVAKPDP